MSLHEVPDFVPIIVHEEAVDLVEVVRTRIFSRRWDSQFHSIPKYFSYQNRLGTRVSESLLYNEREFCPCLSFQKNPDLLIF